MGIAPTGAGSRLAVRWDGAAGAEVGSIIRASLTGASGAKVEFDADLAQHVQAGPETGGRRGVGFDDALAVGRRAGDLES